MLITCGSFHSSQYLWDMGPRFWLTAGKSQEHFLPAPVFPTLFLMLRNQETFSRTITSDRSMPFPWDRFRRDQDVGEMPRLNGISIHACHRNSLSNLTTAACPILMPYLCKQDVKPDSMRGDSDPSHPV